LPILDFKLQAFLDVINELVRADETVRALWVCDNLPGYYRDNPPPEITTLRNEITQCLATSFKYASDDIHADRVVNADNKFMRRQLRCVLLKKEVEEFNAQGLVPHIIDMGPGEYWLPTILKKDGLNFTYFPLGIAARAQENAKEIIGENYRQLQTEEQPTVFAALEVIEHLWNEEEIKSNMLYMCRFADVVHISTPKYTYGFHLKDWRELGELQHLRTYTPKEFSAVVSNMFKEYGVSIYDQQIMHARLVLKGSKFKMPEKLNISKEIEILNQETIKENGGM